MAQIELPHLLNVSQTVYVRRCGSWLCGCAVPARQRTVPAPVVKSAHRWPSTSWSWREDFQKETRCDKESGELKPAGNSGAGRMLLVLKKRKEQGEIHLNMEMTRVLPGVSFHLSYKSRALPHWRVYTRTTGFAVSELECL